MVQSLFFFFAIVIVVIAIWFCSYDFHWMWHGVMGRNYRYVGARGGAGAGAVSGGFPPRSLTSRWSWEFGGRGLLGPGRRSSSVMSRPLSQRGRGGRGSLATTSAILHGSCRG